MSRDGILLMNVGTPDEPTVDSVSYTHLTLPTNA